MVNHRPLRAFSAVFGCHAPSTSLRGLGRRRHESPGELTPACPRTDRISSLQSSLSVPYCRGAGLAHRFRCRRRRRQLKRKVLNQRRCRSLGSARGMMMDLGTCVHSPSRKAREVFHGRSHIWHKTSWVLPLCHRRSPRLTPSSPSASRTETILRRTRPTVGCCRSYCLEAHENWFSRRSLLSWRWG